MKIRLQRFILLIFAVMLSSIVAKADNDTLELKYNEEDGYYEISSEVDMFYFAYYCQTLTSPICVGMTFKVTTPELDLGSYMGYAFPRITGSFGGTFDGQGVILKNIHLVSLFEEIKGGTVMNIVMDESCSCDGYSYSSGAIAVRNECGTVCGCVNNGKVIGGNDTGGIVGRNIKGIVRDCVNNGTIEGGWSTAGIVGWNDGGIITNCTNNGTVIGRDGLCGGIVGSDVSNNKSIISDCFNNGSVISSNRLTGGIAGSIEAVCTVQKCTNSGNIESSSTEIGGIIGYSRGIINKCSNSGNVLGESACGGISGYSSGGIYDCGVTNCTISSNEYEVGAILGKGDSEILSENYYDSDVVVIVNADNSPIMYDGKTPRGKGTYTNPDDVRQMIVNGIYYYNGAVRTMRPEDIPSYNLTYMIDGEVYKTYEVSYDHVIVPEPSPMKEGYTFSGWGVVPERMPAHDVIVTGTFTIDKYVLTYMLDGQVYKYYEIEYGKTIVPEDVPEREGYTFSGWSNFPKEMPAYDVTVEGTFIYGYICLIVWTKNGEQIGYALNKRPILTFTETEIKISGEDIDVIYPMEDFARFTYGYRDVTGIKDIHTDRIMAKFDGENLLFPMFKANSTVSIYMLNGMQVFKKTVHEDGEYVFPLFTLKEGVYLVNINGQTYKFIKK